MKELFQAVGECLAASLPTALLLAGGGTVAVGIGLIFPPAGIIAAGILCMVTGIILIRGGGGSDA